MVDPLTESATIRSSEATFIGLADAASVGVPAFGVMSVGSASTSMG